MLTADLERAALLAEEQTATDPERIGEIHMRLADIDAHSAAARAATMLAGLGFDDAAQRRPASSFSGGWRMRVALAAVLFAQPDLLLLDEPTNYLDLEGTLWLENYVSNISAHRAPVSHDRDLLNRASIPSCISTRSKLTFWRGGYDQFERQRAEQAELMEKAQGQAGRGAQASAGLRRPLQRQGLQGAPGAVAHQGAGEDEADRLDRRRDVQPFSFPEPEQPVARRSSCWTTSRSATGERNPILTKLDLRIDADDRIALLGSNGNGKSTFCKLIGGRLRPAPARCGDRPSLQVAYLRPAPARRTAARGKRLRASAPT